MHSGVINANIRIPCLIVRSEDTHYNAILLYLRKFHLCNMLDT